MKRISRLLAASIALGAVLPTACSALGPAGSVSPGASGTVIRYVALGDSYTIGTSVAADERWPNQLVSALAGKVDLGLVANLGVNGFTTADLIRTELPPLTDAKPDFMTLLIGVNDVVQGVSYSTYGDHVDQILDALLAIVPADRIVVVSVPDYTLTPRGRDFGSPMQQQAAISEINTIMSAACATRGIAFVDINPVANFVPTEPDLVAGDGLHPSGIQYGRWVQLISPVVEGLFKP